MVEERDNDSDQTSVANAFGAGGGERVVDGELEKKLFAVVSPPPRGRD